MNRAIPDCTHGSGVVLAFALAFALAAGACNSSPSDPASVRSVPVGSIPGHDQVAEDNTPKQGPRLVPAETYLRTYLTLFGGLSPLAAQRALQGSSGSALFDTWNDYIASLGLPDYRFDLPRGAQTNTLMIATFERIGVALCDRAMEHDLATATPPPVDQRMVYAFDLPAGTIDLPTFTPRFDVMHRTFLGYPAAMAPTDRTARFFALYQGTVARHAAPGAAASPFTPTQAGWATVCYGLIRHPEFHLY
jgi:hypothetical protein